MQGPSHYWGLEQPQNPRQLASLAAEGGVFTAREAEMQLPCWVVLLLAETHQSALG